MDTAQATAIVARAPFRAIVAAAHAVAKAQGKSGIGFDPHRAGGKEQLVATLCARFGAQALAAALTQSDGAHSTGGAGNPDAPLPESDGREGGESHGDASAPAGNKGEGEAPAPSGNGAPAEGEQTGEGDGQSDAQGAPAEGEGGQTGEGEQSPAAPDAPPPPAPGKAPQPDNPMDAHIYALAQHAASAAVAPVAQYATDILAYASAYADWRAARDRAPSPGTFEHFAPPPAREAFPAAPAPAANVQHPMFPKLLALLAQGEQVALVGPAGTGKTSAAQAAAAALGRHFGVVSGSAGMSESALQGYLIPIGEGGRFEYVPAEFVTSYTGGHGPALFCLDEADAMPSDVLVVANSALANGQFAVPQNPACPLAKRADCLIVLNLNTFGDGAGDAAFTARGAIDAATLDRVAFLEWGYSPEFERALLLGADASAIPSWKPAHDWSKLSPAARAKADEKAVAWTHELRARAAAVGVTRQISIRTAQRMMRALRAGVGADEAKRDVTVHWTADERARVGTKLIPPPAPAAPAAPQA